MKTETEPPSKMLCFFKKLDDGQSPKKKKIVSVDFGHTLFSLLSTLGDAGVGLVPHGPVQSDPIFHSPLWRFTREFHTLSCV
jgi:hypothetical protein